MLVSFSRLLVLIAALAQWWNEPLDEDRRPQLGDLSLCPQSDSGWWLWWWGAPLLLCAEQLEPWLAAGLNPKRAQFPDFWIFQFPDFPIHRFPSGIPGEAVLHDVGNRPLEGH